MDPRPRPARHPWPCARADTVDGDRQSSIRAASRPGRTSSRFIFFTGDRARNICAVSKAFKLVCHQSIFRTLTRYSTLRSPLWAPPRLMCYDPHQKNVPLQCTERPSAAPPAIVRPQPRPSRQKALHQLDPSPWRKPLLQLSWRRPPCSTNRVAQSSLPRVLMVQLPFPVDSSPPCTIQVQPIVITRVSTGGAPQAQFGRCGG